ncbi:serine/threonine protein kinase [Pendulispora brunnea]|uniref:Serine/threonine protein kinase n=1 Tax=Pendulispora brunnea TaxID=2905690 RepID=A0ABZ2KLA6_9BACT
MDLRPDALVTHNVQLVRRLAEGGMGSVWLGRHLALEMPVAVKFMSRSTYLSQTAPTAAEERFTREARAAAQIHHPNVVQILDFGCSSLEGGMPYIVMEYLEGEDLERYLERHGPLEPEDVVSVVLTVASVLEKAHELGIVHRDIKPENVFLQGPERVVKVLDFGVAKDVRGDTAPRRTTEDGEVLGTPFFMSPEQFVNPKGVDRRCDLWALAVLAYESLLGRMPFPGDTPTAIFLAATRGTFELPTRVRPDLPQTVDAWFRIAFATDPARRFSSARAMADAFARAIANRPLDSDALTPLATRIAHMERKWDRRRAALSVALVAAAMALAAFFGRAPMEPSTPANAEPLRLELPAEPSPPATAHAESTAPGDVVEASEKMDVVTAPEPPQRAVPASPSPRSQRTEGTSRRASTTSSSRNAPSLFFMR